MKPNDSVGKKTKPLNTYITIVGSGGSYLGGCRPTSVIKKHAGFTLVEISIVLVIIGLIIGAIMAGRTLVEAATLRAQLTQIEKYNLAVRTFKLKYGYVPGDMPQAAVQSFGFTVATTRPGVDSNGSVGRGNGDNLLQGSDYIGNSSSGWTQGGETFWFWEDLSANSKLIEGRFNTAADSSLGYITGAAQLNLYIPQAKIGYGDYVMVGSHSGLNHFYVGFVSGNNDGVNYRLTFGQFRNWERYKGMPASVAATIDRKADDGLPLSGKIQAPNGNQGFCRTASAYYLTYLAPGNGSGSTPAICQLYWQFQ